ncbi:MAG: Protein FecR [Pseudomonas citronellolis]|nr:MAG: Protein FecR [Pseudomonas citronellolis]
MLNDDERDHADLLFVRTRSGDTTQQSQAWEALAAWADTREKRGYLRGLAQADQALQQVTRTVVRHTPTRAVWLSLAAACLAGVSAALWWVNPSLSLEHCSTAVGEQRDVLLADGSHAVLNTGSALTFNQRLRSREVELLDGEVLFDVQHSSLRPFYVRTQDSTVRVVGTLFDVQRLSDGSRIQVAHGRVQVGSSAELATWLLTDGQAMQTRGGRFVGPVSQTDAQRVGNWKSGRLEFDSVPLSEALAELQRYRRAPILLADRKVGELRLTGSFASNEPDRILALLPSIFAVRVSIDGDGTAHIGPR